MNRWRDGWEQSDRDLLHAGHSLDDEDFEWAAFEVEASPYAQPRDRIPEMLEALSPLPCPVDLFVLTPAEISSARAEGSAFLKVVLSGRVLFER
jgi:hypothetical protein